MHVSNSRLLCGNFNAMAPVPSRVRAARISVLSHYLCLSIVGLSLIYPAAARAQTQTQTQAQTQAPKPVWTADQQPIADEIANLRQLADDVRALATNRLALQIRQLPPSANKVTLAND